MIRYQAHVGPDMHSYQVHVGPDIQANQAQRRLIIFYFFPCTYRALNNDFPADLESLQLQQTTQIEMGRIIGV